jgi:hypothetical protein
MVTEFSERGVTSSAEVEGALKVVTDLFLPYYLLILSIEFLSV